MNTAVTVDKLRHRPRTVGMLTIAASLAAITANAVMVVGDSNTTTVTTPSNTVITATRNATFTVTMPGEIEILLVGGGGGAGGSTSASGYNGGDSRGGGGGGGGVIHKTNFRVTNGTYRVTVGAGGTFCSGDSRKAAATGGSTIGFDLTALGGGPGGWIDPQYNYNIGGLGASGGGGSRHPSNDKSIVGGSALASGTNGNMGYAGANANDYKNGGGGGGACGAGNGVKGGDGYECSITGTNVWYGGGGGGGRRYYAAEPGKGGGKANFGGGGSGQSASTSAPEAGGSGVVIVRFTHDSELNSTTDFVVSGFDKKARLDGGYRYLVITNNTTLHVEGSAYVELLLVGGGGGAGGTSSSSGSKDKRGGGGGGGGVIHMQRFPLSAGDHVIKVGAGGPVNPVGGASAVNGGDTKAFDLRALGGGSGAPATGSGNAESVDGASGGGGAMWGEQHITGGIAMASADNLNLGHNGADAADNWNGGGGGGAGGAGNGVNGGDGYACSITGTTVYYGGGGGGGKKYTDSTGPVRPGLGGGHDSWGGGGSGIGSSDDDLPETGGHGIIVIRYKNPARGTLLMVR